MGVRYEGLDIGHFRAIQRLRIDGLGCVNLITGKNNTAKTTILEAIRILASGASLTMLAQVLRLREEDFNEGDESIRGSDTDSVFPFSSLFRGYPEFSDLVVPILIHGIGGEHPSCLTIEPTWIAETRGEDGVRRIQTIAPSVSDDDEGIPGLRIQMDNAERLLSLDALRRAPYRGSFRRPDVTDDRRLPCQYVAPGAADRTAALGPLWDRIALSDLENDVIEALKLIDDGISAVSMVGGEGTRSSRTAIVRSSRLARPVPLKSFGDGLNRLFGIVLSLVNAKDGLLLIDEFENGLHHSVQEDTWKMIFRLASKLNVQVFATTHSMDAVEAFQKAADDTPEEGVLIRLARKGDLILPTVFCESELSVVTRNQIEVR